MKITNAEFTILRVGLSQIDGKNRPIARNLLERIRLELLIPRQHKLEKAGGL